VSSVLLGLALVGVAAVIHWLAKVDNNPQAAEKGLFSVKQEDESDRT
jgi:hypothetical protein